MADVKVPGVGTVPKKGVAAGLAVLALILGIAYYRHSKNKAAPAADMSQDPNAIDPATGLTYGEEAAGIQSGTLAGAGTPFGDTSGIVGYDAQGQPVYADQVGYGPAPSFVSNGAWSQAVQQYLVATTGADAGTVAAALGTYLAGQPLTDAQAQIVHSAIAFFGQPPQAGSNGYPPSLRLSGVSGTGGGTTGTGGSGDSGGGAGGTSPPSGDGGGGGTGTGGGGGGSGGGGGGFTPAGAISNLRVTGYSHTGVSFAWNPAPRATQGYAWGISGHGITKKGTTTATHVSVSGLTKPGVYNFGIQALPGGPGNNIHTPSLKG